MLSPQIFSSIVAPSGHLVNIQAWVCQRLAVKSWGIERLGSWGNAKRARGTSGIAPRKGSEVAWPNMGCLTAGK